jgi:hypothetical protein
MEEPERMHSDGKRLRRRVFSDYILGFVRGMSNLNHWIYRSMAHGEEGSSWAYRCIRPISRVRLN